MHRRTEARWQGALQTALLGGGLLALAGCGTTHKTVQGTGGSGVIAQGECNQTDSTEACCLKTFPGQYERCGAIPPKKPAPVVPPPVLPDSSVLESAKPTEAERRRENFEICQPYYERCIEKGGEYKKGRKYGETRCQQCLDACVADGFWPLRANGQVCP